MSILRKKPPKKCYCQFNINIVVNFIGLILPSVGLLSEEIFSVAGNHFLMLFIRPRAHFIGSLTDNFITSTNKSHYKFMEKSQFTALHGAGF